MKWQEFTVYRYGDEGDGAGQEYLGYRLDIGVGSVTIYPATGQWIVVYGQGGPVEQHAWCEGDRDNAKAIKETAIDRLYHILRGEVDWLDSQPE